MSDTIIIALLVAMAAGFWWKWVVSEAALHDLRDSFAQYVAEADQRFLRTREGRQSAGVPYSPEERERGMLQDGSPLREVR